MEVYLDDDIDEDRLITTARGEQVRLISPRSLGLRGSHDAVHLKSAIDRRLAFMTRNYKDFPYLHDLILAANGHHFCVILVRKDNDRSRDMSQLQIVRALAKLKQSLSNLNDRLIILNQWR